ncbi:Cell division topological specificity factor like, chloroplastic [Apostasia shenzhenica]|uniref:Cell division topological specificity factor like, chloroplastic n=1 Tax=Apostasia shenzhenica TaxID=1088818 RepID=A0A2I0AZQ0_9ASPA|nr:Cell division topological specificity factor like, chloroplastic [Apostasia shenzhenica]
MAIAGDFRVFAAFNPVPKNSSTVALPSSSSFYRSLSPSSKIHFSRFSVLESDDLETKLRCQHILSLDHDKPHRKCRYSAINPNNPCATTINQDLDCFLPNAVKMSFLERLTLAWKILFPTTTERKNSNAKIAKQRLKMILFADRCAVSDEAKQKIVSSIIKALSDFVEIESQEKVQLSVSTDGDLGTVYSVMVPVRRVKPGYQQSDEEYKGITGIEYKDTGEASGCVDVKFDFYVPNDK